MRCPYCTSEVPEEAVVCAHCARDLYLFKPLLEKIDRLERTVAELQSRQAIAVPASVVVEPAVPVSGRGFPAALAAAVLTTLVLLIAAHGILLFVYDVQPLYLRIATILLPMPVGFMLAMKYPDRLGASAAGGFVMASAAVFGMLIVTATIDKVPILPQDGRDTREVIEYVASIGLAFLTGLLMGRVSRAVRAKGMPPHRVARIISRAVLPDEKGEFGIEKAAKRVDTLIRMTTPAATGAASIYAGIKAFFGDLG